jgi:catechol 2,3-dioxygenase-like lactoylglutathione lyase family enzyme
MQLNHLYLRVKDVARSQQFYERYFGMREHAHRHDGVVFMTDEARFDLVLEPADAIEAFPAWFHFGFRMPNPAEVERLLAEMKQDGVAIIQALERSEGYLSFRCADPTGYAVEVYWE